MKAMSAGKAKNGFGLLIDTARAKPVTIAKHRRAVAVVLSVEAYERLQNRKPGPEASVHRTQHGGEAMEAIQQRKSSEPAGL